MSPPAGLGDPNNPVAGVIIDECPQEMPAYAGKNYNQGQRAGLDQTNQIMYVCDQVSEPWGPVNGIRLGHYPYSLTYLNGTHQYTFSWGTDSLVGPGTPAVYPPDLGVTQPFGGEMVVDSTRCRFCSGLDTNNHAYLDQYVTGTGATLADESSAQTGTYVESLCTNESIGSAGEAYYLLEGYLYRFNI